MLGCALHLALAVGDGDNDFRAVSLWRTSEYVISATVIPLRRAHLGSEVFVIAYTHAILCRHHKGSEWSAESSD